MLPHFVAQDFPEVLGELREWGLAFQPEWFVPHFEFRFPLIGEATYDGMNLELRQAIEPWHVLGEETGRGGTARYVDSSVERLQVKVRGMTGPPARRRRATAAACRCIPRARRANMSPACATGPGSRRTACTPRSACIRRWCSIFTIAGRAARSAVAPGTSRTPAARTSRPSRSTPWMPRAAARRGSRPWAIPPARCRCHRASRTPIIP